MIADTFDCTEIECELLMQPKWICQSQRSMLSNREQCHTRHPQIDIARVRTQFLVGLTPIGNKSIVKYSFSGGICTIQLIEHTDNAFNDGKK